MILLTIGTQLPFERLVRALDELAPTLSMPVFGQIGHSAYQPTNFEFCRSMRPDEFDMRFSKAKVVISHAGIGTILTAQKHRKPIILFPREAAFGEHRNDHQLATCAQLEGQPGVSIARTLDDLRRLLTTDLPSPAADAALQDKRHRFTMNLRDAIEALF